MVDDDRSGRSTFKDVVLFCYLVVGAAGTATLVALQIGIADFLYHFFYFFLLAALIFSSLAWIPAAILIVVYRRSWLITLPAATAIASSITFFLADDISDAPFFWTAAFFPVAFACGFVWVVKRQAGNDS